MCKNLKECMVICDQHNGVDVANMMSRNASLNTSLKRAAFVPSSASTSSAGSTAAGPSSQSLLSTREAAAICGPRTSTHLPGSNCMLGSMHISCQRSVDCDSRDVGYLFVKQIENTVKVKQCTTMQASKRRVQI